MLRNALSCWSFSLAIPRRTIIRYKMILRSQMLTILSVLMNVLGGHCILHLSFPAIDELGYGMLLSEVIIHFFWELVENGCGESLGWTVIALLWLGFLSFFEEF